MDKKYKLNKIIPIIVLVIFVIISFILIEFRKEKDSEIKEITKNEYKLLNDYSRFFTINSCIIRYITYLKNNDVDSILKVLNSNYVNSNNINEDNLFSFVDNIDGNYSFISNKIYYKNIKDYYVKYYVSGNLLEDTINGEFIKESKYYVVTMDTKKQVFDIAPYDGEIFKGEV